MYYNLIKNYVEKLTKEDIRNYAMNQGIELKDDEVDVIYMYTKNHWETFYYGNPKELLEELKNKLNITTYKKIEMLYKEFKDKGY